VTAVRQKHLCCTPPFPLTGSLLHLVPRHTNPWLHPAHRPAPPHHPPGGVLQGEHWALALVVLNTLLFSGDPYWAAYSEALPSAFPGMGGGGGGHALLAGPMYSPAFFTPPPPVVATAASTPTSPHGRTAAVSV
jgi:hypothetical protein